MSWLSITSANYDEEHRVSEQPDYSAVELTEEGLAQAADAAIRAFDVASNLDELNIARRDHLGDAAPIPQARR
ncbi:phenylalanine--tRNA ligase subunit alpha, partial [Corynebacterium belfantii]